MKPVLGNTSLLLMETNKSDWNVGEKGELRNHARLQKSPSKPEKMNSGRKVRENRGQS